MEGKHYHKILVEVSLTIQGDVLIDESALSKVVRDVIKKMFMAYR